MVTKLSSFQNICWSRVQKVTISWLLNYLEQAMQKTQKKGTNFVIGLIKEKIREYQMSSKKAKDVQIQEQSKFLTN